MNNGINKSINKLDKNAIYIIQKWVGIKDEEYTSYAFAYDYNSGYFAYIKNISEILNLKEGETTEIIFIDAHKTENRGMKSKVSDWVLNRKLTKLKDFKIKTESFNGLQTYITRTKQKKKDKERTMDKNYVGAYNLVEVNFIGYLDEIKEAIKRDFEPTIVKISPNLYKTIKLGDVVVVDTYDGLEIGVVSHIYTDEITQENIEAANKAKVWIVNKVDTKEHIKRIEATERKKFITMELQRRKEELEEKAVWEMLAKQDETAAKLLEELKELETTNQVTSEKDI